MRLPGPLLILCYHAFTDLSDDARLAPYGIRPELFARHLDELAARGFSFVSPDELARALTAGERLPGKAVLLTFDDCYQELSEVAAEVLAPRGIAGIAFAVSGMASGTNEWDQAHGARRLTLLDDAGLRDLATLGLEIGCHSRSHRRLNGLSVAELEAETSGAAADIAAMGLPAPRFFAYPFGTHDGASRAAVERAGFLAGFALETRRAGYGSDRMALPRVDILGTDRGWRFTLKTAVPRPVTLMSKLRRAVLP